MSDETPEGVIHRFASLLEQVGIPYMLTGSFASGFHGAPRATHDIDFVIAPNLGSLNHLLRLLPEDRYYANRQAALEAYGAESLFNVIDFATGWKIDFICRKTRPYSVAEFARRAPRELGGERVFVTTAEDTILSKLEWAKLTDSERQLRDVASVIEIQGRTLDMAYIEHWVDALSVQTQWARAKALAG